MKKLNSGVTLVEVLVVILILAIGLLGLAAMQAYALKMNNGAYFNTQATFAIYEILDQIRANKDNAANYTIAMTADPETSPSTLAKKDVKEWVENLADSLPEGDGALNVTVSSGVVTVNAIVQWQDGDQTKNLATEAVL